MSDKDIHSSDLPGKNEPAEPPVRKKAGIGRRIWRGVRNSFLIFLGLLLAVIVLLQFPAVQTWMGGVATRWLSSKSGIDVRIEKVNINFFRLTVDLRNVYVADHHQDTLIHAGEIFAGVGDISFSAGRLDLSSVTLESGYMNMRRYKNEEKPNLSVLMDKFKNPDKKKKPGAKPFIISIRNVELIESKVRVRNDQQEARDADFLPNDIRINRINGLVSDFLVNGDSISFEVKNLRAWESSGLILTELSSKVLICSKELRFTNFKLHTPRSQLSGFYSMRYDNWTSFSDFVNKVTMVVDLDLSNIHMADIAYFSGGLRGLNTSFRFRGGAKGTLADLKAKNISIYFGSVTQIDGSVELKGLPDINNTFIFFDLKKMVTDYHDLGLIPLPPFNEGKTLTVPRELTELGVMKFKGNFTGFLKDFAAYGNLQTSGGNARMDVKLAQIEGTKLFSYSGSLKVDDLALGRLTRQEKTFGNISFDGNIKGKGFALKEIDAEFKGNVRSFDLNNYVYHNLAIDGGLKNQEFTGKLKLDDPNAKLDFKGAIDFTNAKNPQFAFSADISETDFGKLNLVKSDSAIDFSSKVTINMSGKSIDDLVGNLLVTDTRYSVGTSVYTMDTLLLVSSMVDTLKSFELTSDFVDADFDGYFKFIPLLEEVKRRLNYILPSMIAFEEDPKAKRIAQNFTFNIHLKDVEPVTRLLMPTLTINKNSIIYGSYNSERNDLTIAAKSSGIKFRNFMLDNWSLSADNNGQDLAISTEADAFYFTDSLHVDNFKLRAEASQDSLTFWTGFQNKSELLNAASIQGTTFLGDAPHFPVKFFDTYFYFQDTLWMLNNDNLVDIDSGKLEVRNLALYRERDGKELLKINGISSPGATEPLMATFADFPLSIINFATAGSNLELKGYVGGDVSLFQIFSNPYFTSDITISQFGLNGIDLGNLGLQSSYDNVSRGLTINAELENNGEKNISITNGKFYPFREESQFKIDVDINNLNIAALEKFATPIMSDLRGLLSGRFSLAGNAKKPVLFANVNLRNGGLKVSYLNAFFNISMDMQKSIVLNNNNIVLPELTLTDRYGNRGTFSGNVRHELFKDIYLDFDITANNLCLMETTPKMNEQFYGDAFASGTASIRGPLTNLRVSADMRTEAKTLLNIPIRGTSKVSEINYVTFINKKADTLLTNNTAVPVLIDKNFTVDLKIQVTPSATVRIIMDETTGDVITANGRSEEIKLGIDTKGRFEISGNYEITKGSYTFTLQDLIKKPFQIKPGSYVAFSGNPYDAIINATAVYAANASLYPIVSAFMDLNTAEQYKRASRVLCELTLTNRLSNMMISFNLEVPNADESTRSIVKSVISTEEERNRQVFALLVLNQFLPPESTGSGSAGTNMISSGLGTTSTELLSGQLNNWLSKLTTDVNLNLIYKPGDNTTADQYGVGVSTQIFSDRLILDGDVGVGGQNKTVQSQNQIVGNVTVEFKATRDGQVRIKAFNRSNENNLLKNSVPYTQGMGITYRREFDSWKDLFKKKIRVPKTVTAPDTTKEVEPWIYDPDGDR